MIKRAISKWKDPRFLVVVGVAALIMVIGLVLSLSGQTSAPRASESPRSNQKPTSSEPSDVVSSGELQKEGSYSGWKLYRSITESNLSFYYPADWYFVPPKDVVTNNANGKYNSMTLYSTKPVVSDGGGAPVATNQFMCIKIDEYQGSWPYNDPYNYPVATTEEFTAVNQTSLLLTTYKGDQQMKNSLGISASSPGEHGAKFIPLKNGYFAMFTAQYNCLQGGEDIQNPDADFDKQPATITAKKILKSINY